MSGIIDIYQCGNCGTHWGGPEFLDGEFCIKCRKSPRQQPARMAPFNPSSFPQKGIRSHEGKKYLRRIVSPLDGATIEVDVYAVLEAFKVTCPGRAQAVKKLLCAGERGKGDPLADLIGADAALARAIDLQRQREQEQCQAQAQSNSSTTDQSGS